MGVLNPETPVSKTKRARRTQTPSGAGPVRTEQRLERGSHKARKPGAAGSLGTRKEPSAEASEKTNPVDWMPVIIKYTLYDAGYFYIPKNIFEQLK